MGISAGGLGLIGAGVDLTGGLISDIFGYNSAKQQENFQMYMSDTAYQRAVTSMKAAGLNPILAAGGSPASTPSGTSFTPANPAKGAASSAIDIANATQQLSNLQKQGTLLDVQVEKAYNDSQVSNNQAHASALDAYIADAIVSNPGKIVNGKMQYSPLELMTNAKVDSAVAGARQLQLNNQGTAADNVQRAASAQLYQALPQASWLREILPLLKTILGR